MLTPRCAPLPCADIFAVLSSSLTVHISLRHAVNCANSHRLSGSTRAISILNASHSNLTGRQACDSTGRRLSRNNAGSNGVVFPGFHQSNPYNSVSHLAWQVNTVASQPTASVRSVLTSSVACKRTLPIAIQSDSNPLQLHAHMNLGRATSGDHAVCLAEICLNG